MKRLFEFFANTLNGSERSILDLLSAIVPYAVPIIPAYLTYYHTMEIMNFPSWVAATAAFVVEVLGMTSVSTAIRFWRNNLHYKTEQNKAPFKLAVAVYAFYIIVVLSVNVILEMVANTRSGWVILTIGLFTLLSFPSGVLISIRAQYSEMLELRNTPRGKSKEQTQPEKPLGFSNQKYASNYREKILVMLDEQFTKDGTTLAPKAITTRLRLDHSNNKGYISNLTKEWRAQRTPRNDPE